MTRTLAQVGPDERGIPWKVWFKTQLDEIFRREYAKVTKEQRANAPINSKRFWSARDSYGI